MCEKVVVSNPGWAENMANLFMPYQVKTQYVQIFNIVDTFIKHQFSDESTSMLKVVSYSGYSL